MIFVDTSAWYALEVEDDVNHAEARGFLGKVAASGYGISITTDYVIDETLTLLRMRRGLEAASKFVDKVRGSKSVKIFWVGEELFDKAVILFRSSSDRSWSFTDCTSFALMRELQMSDAYAFDKHFSEAGSRSIP